MTRHSSVQATKLQMSQINRQNSVFVQVHQSKIMHILVVNLVGSGSGRIQSLWIWSGSGGIQHLWIWSGSGQIQKFWIQCISNVYVIITFIKTMDDVFTTTTATSDLSARYVYNHMINALPSIHQR